jgi:hypothetical protein
VASDDTFHHVAVTSASTPDGGAFITPLECDRVYFAGNRGLCLQSGQEPSAIGWRAVVFDEGFTPRHALPLTGSPSRVRISADGRYGSATVFESGHSYAGHGFSTRTSLFDLQTGATITDLEQFQVTRDGRPFQAEDFNFWGVTFATDSDVFYATLDTGGISYLIRGSVSGRTATVLRAGVECPSLSPDNTRIAFKKRVGARSLGWWQIAVLRLDTMIETPVTRETRSVDDQVEWLDNDQVLYHLTGGSTAADLWSVRVDNGAPPQLVRAAAYSPSVVR